VLYWSEQVTHIKHLGCLIQVFTLNAEHLNSPKNNLSPSHTMSFIWTLILISLSLYMCVSTYTETHIFICNYIYVCIFTHIYSYFIYKHIYMNLSLYIYTTYIIIYQLFGWFWSVKESCFLHVKVGIWARRSDACLQSQDSEGWDRKTVSLGQTELSYLKKKKSRRIV
jgi:hypothetical protein